MGGMQPDSFYNSQLFAFIFAFCVFAAGIVLMNIAVAPGIKRMNELDHD